VVATPLAVAVGDTVPHADAEQATAQVTPLFAASLATVAVICCVPLACTVAEAGETDTVMGGGGGVLTELPPPQAKVPRPRTANTTHSRMGQRFLEVMADLARLNWDLLFEPKIRGAPLSPSITVRVNVKHFSFGPPYGMRFRSSTDEIAPFARVIMIFTILRYTRSRFGVSVRNLDGEISCK
jgi:hypothetical protein